MIFKKIKEIISKDGVLHFRRWQVLGTPWFTINLHGIYHEDEERDLHNHPFDFISIVLFGSYTEKLNSGKTNERKIFNIAKRKSDVFHKIEKLHSKKIFTLNLMWNRKKEWGYLVDGKLIEHDLYRKLKNTNSLEFYRWY